MVYARSLASYNQEEVMQAGSVNTEDAYTVAEYDIEYYITELDSESAVDDLFNFLTNEFVIEINKVNISGSQVSEEFTANYSAVLNNTISKSRSVFIT